MNDMRGNYFAIYPQFTYFLIINFKICIHTYIQLNWLIYDYFISKLILFINGKFFNILKISSLNCFQSLLKALNGEIF